MAMPRKGSRLFTLDGVVYRWRVRDDLAYNGRGTMLLTFLVERAENPGAVLRVHLPNSWWSESVGEQPVAIRPALVRACLRRALGKGWPADKPGPPFTLDIDQEELSVMMDETLVPSQPLQWG